MPTLRQRFRAASHALRSSGVVEAFKLGTTFGASSYEDEEPSRSIGMPAAVEPNNRWVDILESAVDGGDTRFLAAVDRVSRQLGAEYTPALLERNWERLTSYDIAALDKKSPRKVDEIWHSMEGHATGRALKAELRAIVLGKGLAWKPLENENSDETRDRLYLEEMWKGQGGPTRRRPLQQAVEHHLREYHRGGSLAEVEYPTVVDPDGLDRISSIRLVRRSRFDMYEDELGYPLRIRGEILGTDGKRIENAEIGRDDPRWNKLLFGTFPDIETTGRFLGEPANYAGWPYWVGLSHHEQQERFTTERYANVFPEARYKGKAGGAKYDNAKLEMLKTLAKARRGWGMVTPGDWEILFHSPNVSGPKDLLDAAKIWSERQWRVGIILVVNTSGTMVSEGTFGANQAIITGVRDKLRDELRERVLATVLALSLPVLQANFYGRAQPSRMPQPEFIDDDPVKRKEEIDEVIQLTGANLMTTMEGRRKLAIEEVTVEEAESMASEQSRLVDAGLMVDPSMLAGAGVTVVEGDEDPAAAPEGEPERALPAGAVPPPQKVDTVKVRGILADLADPAAPEVNETTARDLLALEGVPEDRVERMVGSFTVAATATRSPAPDWIRATAERMPRALERLDHLVAREGFDATATLPVMRQLGHALRHGAPNEAANVRAAAAQKIHDHLQEQLELDLPSATTEQERLDVLERAIGDLTDPETLWSLIE